MTINKPRLSGLICALLALSHVVAQEAGNRMNFGAKLGINYCTLGAKNDTYAGGVNPSLGMYYSFQPADRINLIVEPAYSAVTFKQQQSDTKYESHYLDFSFYGQLFPSKTDRDLSFILGLRPSMLLGHSTSEFQTGSYVVVRDPANKNENLSADLGVVFGMSVALSPIVNFELLYHLGVTDNNTSTVIQGRPSTIEAGIRISALQFKKESDTRQQQTADLVRSYEQGSLLVMLLTPNQAELDELSRNGQEEKVNMIKNELRMRNKLVMHHFRSGYTFTPVLFYFDTNASLIKDGRYRVVPVFLNDDLVADSSITADLERQPYFIASFTDDHSEYTAKRNYGLYVYDRDMKQLPRPFNKPKHLASPAYEFDMMKSGDAGIKIHTYIHVPFGPIIAEFNAGLVKYKSKKE